MQTLQHLTSKATQAHYWTSFSPEKRGEQLVKNYSEQLAEDVAELESAGIDSATIETYKSRYEQLFSSWLSAKGRCISSMITGPARFPVRKAEKANRSEEKHYQVFQEWRTRAKKAIVRKAAPEKTFLSEIDRYKNELEQLKQKHQLAKDGNKKVAAARKSGEDITEYLQTVHKVQPHMLEWAMKFGFNTVNLLANIHRVEDRIKLMERKEERSQSIGVNEFKFDGFTVIYNHEADRIQVRHDAKPAPDVLQSFKKAGFRFSYQFTAWQRNLNSNGIWAAERLLNIKLPSINQAKN